MNKQKRIPLKNNVTEDTIIAESRYNEWLWWDNISRTDNTPHEVVFVKPDEKTSIHYIEDYIIKISYIVARGEEANKVIEEAKNSLDCYSWQEILDEYATAENHRQKIQTVYIAGTAAPLEFSPEYKKFFDNSLQDEHPDVRIATIVAMGYMGWTEWIPVLQDLNNNDPDETVRDSAAGMINSFAANGKYTNETNATNQPEETEEQRLAQLQEELQEDKEQLKNLQAQLKKVEAEIENSRRTNIWGRPESGKSEAERDRLVQEIVEIQDKITQNESLLEAKE